MKSFIVRMTGEQNTGEIEEIIRSLARFVGAEVMFTGAVEVRTEHPVIVAMLEQMTGGMSTPAQAKTPVAAPAAKEVKPVVASGDPKICTECGGPRLNGVLVGICRKCQNARYNAKLKAKKDGIPSGDRGVGMDIPTRDECTPEVQALLDPVGVATVPVLAFRCSNCQRTVAKVNKHGLCGQCNLERRTPGEDRLQAAIERVVAQAQARDQHGNENLFLMPQRNLRSGRKVG